jgi:hypothetical protein
LVSVETHEPLAHWSPALGAALTSSVIRSHHRLAELSEFADDRLPALLDRHPREKLQAYAPGASGVSDWPAVDLGAADGAALLDAVSLGTLWLNVIDVDAFDEQARALQARLFDEIARVVPDLLPGTMGSTLLISSPGASVPFHLDPEPNVLWQLQGRKRIYMYPAANDAFVTRETREDLFAGYAREFADYESDFDEAALIEEVAAGDLIAWPQNGPHRIVNLEGMNVTLSTIFQTRRSRRRRRVYCANRFLNRSLHLPARSTAEHGLASTMKVGAFGAARRLGLARPGTPPAISAELRLDASGQIEPLTTPIQAEFV